MNVPERPVRLTIPRIGVLLATYNGIKWLPEQVASILDQRNVDLELVVSDDLSTDGTWEWLQELASNDTRVKLLPQEGKFGGAARNFYRLLVDADLSTVDFVALADQDDIWEPNKLSRHAEIINQEGYEAVSSNVTAFWADNRTRLIAKSFPQCKFDFLFESPGPGCSFLVSKTLVEKMREILACEALHADRVLLHDWLIYAVCRSAGKAWFIDPVPSLLYRQHAFNEFGANSGWQAKLSRARKISGGWYRDEVQKISRICAYVSGNPQYEKIATLVESAGAISSRIKLLPIVWQGRRRLVHRLALGIAVLTGML